MALGAGILSLSLSTKSPPSIEEGLVGHWSFDQPQDKVIDRSTFQAHAEIKGNPKIIDGIVGKGALRLDGRNDYLEILQNRKPPSHIQQLKTGSISLWFKAHDIPVGESISPILYYGNKNGCPDMFDASNEGLIIELAHGRVYPNAKGIFYTVFSNRCDYPSLCYDSHSDPHLRHQKGIIEEDRWYHFVVVVGKNFNTGYLNGKEISFRHYNFNTPRASQFFADAISHERFWLGKGHWDHAQKTFFDGALDDVRIYNRPLNKNEVQKLYARKNDW